MSYLKNAETGELITRFVSCKHKQSRTLIVQTALDGTEYLTRFGSPVDSYELTLFLTKEGQSCILQAADNLSLLEFSVRAGTFSGRIIKLSDFERLTTEWSKVTLTLSAESEAVER